jgi:hypothetical protein
VPSAPRITTGGRASRATRAIGGVGDCAQRPRGAARRHGRLRIPPGRAEQSAKRPPPVWAAGSPAFNRSGGREIRGVADDAVRLLSLRDALLLLEMYEAVDLRKFAPCLPPKRYWFMINLQFPFAYHEVRRAYGSNSGRLGSRQADDREGEVKRKT